MKKYAKVENNIVVEILKSENVLGEGYVETDFGIRNRPAEIGFIYDSELDMFFMPIPEDAITN